MKQMTINRCAGVFKSGIAFFALAVQMTVPFFRDAVQQFELQFVGVSVGLWR